MLEAIQLETIRAEGYVFQIEVTYRALLAGFRVDEIPIVFRDRSVGIEQDVGTDRSSRPCGPCRSCADAAAAEDEETFICRRDQSAPLRVTETRDP